MEANLAFVGPVETGDAVQQGGLAAAGGAEDGGDSRRQVGIHGKLESGEALSQVQAYYGRRCHVDRLLSRLRLWMRT